VFFFGSHKKKQPVGPYFPIGRIGFFFYTEKKTSHEKHDSASEALLSEKKTNSNKYLLRCVRRFSFVFIGLFVTPLRVALPYCFFY
jgi:hypothetical protein